MGKYIETKENRPIVNQPLADGIQIQQMIEEINWITSDLSEMPDCAEKIALVLLKNLLRLKLTGSVYLSKTEEIEILYKNLKLQIKNKN